ncbi:MAG: hypothetical protein [Olavius algarvensis Delta 4 endosymbiont]|nr:MAG: hypothetical protein [Olavius algarvensis Delta 4 endosymbiont]
MEYNSSGQIGLDAWLQPSVFGLTPESGHAMIVLFLCVPFHWAIQNLVLWARIHCHL